MEDRNALLAKFHEVASDPRAQMDRYLAEGRKIAGIAAPYGPEELVHSMGFVPMGVWGGDLELNEAKKYFPTFICSVMQSIVELGIKGAFDGMSFITIPSLCDSMQVTAENWKYAVPSIPVIFADYPHNRTKAGHDYIVATAKRHADQINKLTGAEYSDEKLASSIEIYKEHAELMLKFSELAGKSGMAPSDRNAVFKSAFFMLKEEHSELLKELIGTLEPADHKKIRIYTTGILADQPDLLKAMDDLGMTVVCDDVAHESRQYYVQYEGSSPMDVLADKFCGMKHCSLIYDYGKSRIPMILEEYRKNNAQAIVMIQTKFCDPEEFDYVFIKRECDAAGIPLVMIEVDRQMTKYDQAKTALQTLKEML